MQSANRLSPPTVLPRLERNGLPALAKQDLNPVRVGEATPVIKAGNQLLVLNGENIEIWNRQDKECPGQTFCWRDGNARNTKVEHMQLVDKTLILTVNDGNLQLWRAEKGGWKHQLNTNVADLGSELAKSNTREKQHSLSD
jgi:hypothetical protein